MREANGGWQQSERPAAWMLPLLVVLAGISALDQVLDMAVVKRGVLALAALLVVGPVLAGRGGRASGLWFRSAGARLLAAVLLLALPRAFDVWPRAELADRLAGFALLQLAAAAGLAAAGGARRLLPGAILASAALSALLAWAQALRLETVLPVGSGEVVAFAGNSNRAGALLALGCVAAFATLAGARRPGLPALILALLAGALVLTRARGAIWFAAPAGLVTVAALGWKTTPARRARAGLAVSALLLGILAAAAVGGEGTLGARKLSAQGAPFSARDSTTGVRAALWRASAALVADHPLLGVGLGRFAAEIPLYREPAEAALPGREGAVTTVEHPHSEPLHAAAEGGLLAGLLLLALLAWTLARAARAAALRPDGASLVAAGVLIAGIVLALGQDALTDPGTAVPFFAAVGFAWSPRADEQRTGATHSRLAGLLALALALGAAGLALPRIHAHLLYRSSLLRSLEASDVTPESFALLVRAADAAPGDVALQRHLVAVGLYYAPRAATHEETVAAIQSLERARERVARLAPHDT